MARMTARTTSTLYMSLSFFLGIGDAGSLLHGGRRDGRPVDEHALLVDDAIAHAGADEGFQVALHSGEVVPRPDVPDAREARLTVGARSKSKLQPQQSRDGCHRPLIRSVVECGL